MKGILEKRNCQEGNAFSTRKVKAGLRTSFCGEKRLFIPVL